MKAYYRKKETEENRRNKAYNFIEVYEGSLTAKFYYRFTIMLEFNGVKKTYIGKVSEEQMQEEIANMERLHEDEVKAIICNQILDY